MTILNKTLAATTATLLVLSGAAYADAHALDLNAARLDVSLDTDGDGTVTDDEIIAGNMALFDTDGSGSIDATERSNAELMIMGGNSAEASMDETGSTVMTIDFDPDTARLDTTLDANGDGEVDDDEIIRGNMALFDTNGSGAIDASERAQAEEMLRTGGKISVEVAVDSAGEISTPAVDFDVNAARLDVTLDTDGDGEVTIDEIIAGNMAIFDTNNSGTINANERSEAELILMNN